MHSIFKALSLIGLSMVVFACSDWTDAEALRMTQYSNTEIAKKATYYQAPCSFYYKYVGGLARLNGCCVTLGQLNEFV